MTHLRVQTEERIEKCSHFRGFTSPADTQPCLVVILCWRVCTATRISALMKSTLVVIFSKMKKEVLYMKSRESKQLYSVTEKSLQFVPNTHSLMLRSFENI